MDLVELFRKCADGDAHAWEELFRRYDRQIRLTTLRIVRHYRVTEEYEDVLQALSADLYARRRRIFEKFEVREPDSEARYLRVVVGNWVRRYCLATSRRHSREVPQDSSHEPRALESELPSITLDEAIRIFRRDPSNKNIERDVKILHFYFGQGYTSAEIAEFRSIGLSESGVEGVILRAKRSIQQAISSPRPNGENPSVVRSLQEDGRE